MSDVDIDIESDDDNDSDNGQMGGSLRQSSMQNVSQAEKRAHHNALERKRRDHIKESFTSLREAVPSLRGEKASRAQILKKTTECIQTMRRKIQMNQRDVEEKRQQNRILENQLRMLEKAKSGIAIDAAEYNMLSRGELLVPQDSSDDGDSPDFSSRSKKMKTSYQI